MINLLREAWALYRRNLKIILEIMLPAVMVGIPVTGYLELTLGLASGTFESFKVPTEISVIFSLFFMLLLFLMVLIVSQLALFAAIKNEGISPSMAYSLGRRKSFNVFKTLKFLVKLFWSKHLFFLFVILFICNAFMGIFIKPHIENLLVQQAMFSFVNFLLFIPFVHLYGFCLYRKKNQLQSSAENS